MANLTCPKCGKKFNSDDLRVFKCKDCKAWLDWDASQVVQTVEPPLLQTDAMDNLDDATKALVLATDRTTYAVRSLALFLFTTLFTSLVGYGLIGASAGVADNCDSYSPCGAETMVIGGWVVISVGFIIGLIVGMLELYKSKP